jgi:LuxR family maltose regulon positive regulatory protein
MTIPQAKICLPTSQTALVARPRLLQRLDGATALQRSVTLLCAPAGFGKTTLVSQWAQSAPASTRVIWMSLHAQHNRGAQFADDMCAACALAGIDWVRADNGERSIVDLLCAIEAVGQRVVLVLDDYHLMHSPHVHAAVQHIVDHCHSNFHLILISREHPQHLALGRLRLTERLTEIGANALGFTCAEAHELLNDSLALDLTSNEVALLHARAERWVAGLKLMGLALQQGEDMDAVSGTHPYIQTYLHEEVLAYLPTATQVFVLATSTLDVIHPLYCDALLDRSDSVEMLRLLVAANVFIDAVNGQYRYHTLFRDFLRHECARRLVPEALPTEIAVCGESLSDRETEVMGLVSQGLSNADIARQLCISTGTVKRHVHNIFSKLNARSRVEAVARIRA